MKVRAVVKDIGVMPYKARLVINMVRGKKVEEALTILGFMPTPTARAVAKAIKSASANAENNSQMSPADLRITEIFADEGHTLKRFRPQSRARISPIVKRSSHITVVVSEEEE
jgi:large subunit ribosomal protein L22